MSRFSTKNNVELSDILELCLGSDVHRNWFVKDIDRLFIEPLKADHARLFYRDGKVIGFISWAFLSYEAEDAFVNGTRKLQSDDWKSGNRIWIIDCIAPYGDVGSIGRWARDHLTPYGPSFSTDRAFWLRRSPNGSVRKIGMAMEHVTQVESV